MSSREIVIHSHLSAEFPDAISTFAAQIDGWHLRVTDPGDHDELQAALAHAEVLVAGPLDGEGLERAGQLRLHVVPFAGVNRLPLMRYAERGIAVASSHGNAPQVAERAVALTYAAAGRVVEFDAALRKGNWHRRHDPAQPFDYWRSLRGARLALLGGGAIGAEVARLLRPLVGSTCAVVRQRRSVGEHDPFDMITDSVDEALARADVVVAALPATEQTRGLLTAERLAQTNRAIFVNVGRAELVGEDTLYTALTDGTLSAAGLDVWYRAPDPFWADARPAQQPFEALANVVLSPHAASHTESAKRGQLMGALELVGEFVRTGRVARTVDPGAGY